MNIKIKKIKDGLIAAKGSLVTAIGIITNIATIISVVIVLLTLKEMQIQRNNAYRPDIIFEPVQVNISWGDSEKIDKPSVSADEILNPDTISIPTRNIGVGSAKQIMYSIDISTFIKWLDILNSIDHENEYSYSQEGSMFNVNLNGSEVMFGAEYEMTKTFLLPNAEEVFDFVLPVQYTRLLQEIYSVRGADYFTIPDIVVSVLFTDVQGVEYTQKIPLSINNIYIVEDSDGNGAACYQIKMN